AEALGEDDLAPGRVEEGLAQRALGRGAEPVARVGQAVHQWQRGRGQGGSLRGGRGLPPAAGEEPEDGKQGGRATAPKARGFHTASGWRTGPSAAMTPARTSLTGVRLSGGTSGVLAATG